MIFFGGLLPVGTGQDANLNKLALVLHGKIYGANITALVQNFSRPSLLAWSSQLLKRDLRTLIWASIQWEGRFPIVRKHDEQQEIKTVCLTQVYCVESFHGVLSQALFPHGIPRWDQQSGIPPWFLFLRSQLLCENIGWTRTNDMCLPITFIRRTNT